MIGMLAKYVHSVKFNASKVNSDFCFGTVALPVILRYITKII